MFRKFSGLKFKIMKVKLFRFELFENGKSRFVDWYRNETKEMALECALEDCHRYGIPAGFTHEIREATKNEYATLED